MPKLTFFPLGNADCLLMDLAGGEKLIFDYANTRNPDDANDKRIDLEAAIRDDLDKAGRDRVNVFAISHLDNDHICGSSNLFWLEHAASYQSDDRIRIDELWVPACVIIEDGLVDEGRIWRQEARHRLKQGKGIRVFSRPEVLENWAKLNGVDLDAKRHLFVDAGQLVPGWDLADKGGRVLRPFAVRQPPRRRDADGP